VTSREIPSEWLVDGFNVLQVGGLCRDEGKWWKGPARRLLVSEVEKLATVSGTITLVFDGPDPVEDKEAFPSEGIRVVFAPSADDWILANLRERGESAEVAVVTADRRLSGKCRGRGAQLESPAAFLARCRDAREASAPS
jgi:predicted RNA-binding protein with PIN domain